MITKHTFKTYLGSGVLTLLLLATPTAFAEDESNTPTSDKTPVELSQKERITDAKPVDLEKSEQGWLHKIKSYFTDEYES